MEEELVPRAGLRLERMAGGPIVGVPRLTALKNGLKLAGSVYHSWQVMGQFKPDLLLVTGGYMSVPVALAAKLRRVPAVAYVPDIEPGSALKFIGRFVDHVAATFPETAAYFPAGKVFATGYPVRAELERALQLTQAEALAQFDLQPGRPTLFVFGGSRGAWSINEALVNNLPTLLEQVQIIHVTGTLTWPKIQEQLEKIPAGLRSAYYRPYPYLHEEMGAGFRAADLVIARAGASMLGESPLFGVPCILVPYPHAWRYQKINADYLADRGAAVRLNDEELGTKLTPLIQQLINHPDQLATMRHKALALSTPQAAHKLAQTLLNLGRGEKQ